MMKDSDEQLRPVSRLGGDQGFSFFDHVVNLLRPSHHALKVASILGDRPSRLDQWSGGDDDCRSGAKMMATPDVPGKRRYVDGRIAGRKIRRLSWPTSLAS